MPKRGGHNRRPRYDAYLCGIPVRWDAEDRGYATPCWIWNGPKDKRLGYGCAQHNGQSIKAHRLVYEAVVGKIPDGLVVDHLCRVTSCVNPDHLEPVTQRENLMRGNTPAARKAAQTHCIHGHEFTPENTYRHGDGSRSCRACSIRRSLERQRRLKEERHAA
jgi:hypothetical protein